tara:strand:+ start:971 stop:1222 length:252 start_codon:yes stop_codon:yes gene_type:complete
MLPVVTRELVESLRESAKDKNFIESSWVEMSIKNLELFSAISDSTDVFTSRPAKEAFLRGAFLTWLLLYKQDEVDDMNESWGA